MTIAAGVHSQKLHFIDTGAAGGGGERAFFLFFLELVDLLDDDDEDDGRMNRLLSDTGKALPFSKSSKLCFFFFFVRWSIVPFVAISFGL